jgi:hypothetical protein
VYISSSSLTIKQSHFSSRIQLKLTFFQTVSISAIYALKFASCVAYVDIATISS